MATKLVGGPLGWRLTRDEAGHRDYELALLVKAGVTDGPANVLQTPGLPVPGSLWQVDNDIDVWAFCKWNAKVTPKASTVERPEPTEWWIVEIPFSTKTADVKSCREFQFDDPLLEPPKISFQSNNYQEEAVYDRFGLPILTSSHELIRGPQNEWDAGRVRVRIEQNVATIVQAFQLPVSMFHTLNDAPLWGVGRRKVKLSDYSAEKKYYGSCYSYYTRVLEFDVRYDGFDRDLLDEGTKALHGHWDEDTGAWVLDPVDDAGTMPDPFNPAHFDRYKDRKDENARVILDGSGKPIGSTIPNSKTYVAVATNLLGVTPPAAGAWVERDGPPAAQKFSAAASYKVGDVAYVEGSTTLYVCTTANAGISPPNAGYWLQLPFGLNDRGLYQAGATYNTGDWVRLAVVGTPGRRHVEKYGESNLLLLNLPLIL